MTYAQPDSGRPAAAWRLIRDSAHSAAWNMAVDQAILDAVEDGLAPPTLRIYRWQETAVSVGRFQHTARTVRLDDCSERGIPIVRRPTGGRGVLHGGDITLSIVIPAAHLGEDGKGIASSYRRLSSGIAAGLARLGVAPGHIECSRRERQSGDCFATVSRADLVIPGSSKVVGSAQRRMGSTILQQSSIRHKPAEVEGAELFQGEAAPADYPLRKRSVQEVEDALTAGFQAALGIKLCSGLLTGWEEERAAVLTGRMTVQSAKPKVPASTTARG